MTRKLVLVGLVLLLAWAVEPAVASRAPTYLERVTIMDTFNIPGRSFSSKCVRIVVSTVDPRYAMLTTPARQPRACVRGGEVGNGFVLFRRSSRTSLRWRNIREGNAVPCFLRRAVRRDLFGTTFCSS
jgi:hypothetical protein